MQRVLYIEDSASLRRSVANGLRAEGFTVDVAADGTEGAWLGESGAFDVVVLDLMLPGLHGLDVLARIRRARPDTHVLVLSARDGLDDRIRGLDAGADDYLVKPFSFDELVARIRALVRRRFGLNADRVEVGGVVCDLRSHVASFDGVPLELAPRELALLELLMTRRGKVVSRAEIETCVYDERVQPLSNVVDSSISLLRRALREAGAPELIATRRGLGYVIDAAPETA